jgi:spore coat polysaccharide biosynthesis protein SpsF
MSTADLWAGDFGNAYLERNRVDWRLRLPFWRSILSLTGAHSILEVGCNAGWNLRALRSAGSGLDLHGIDLNEAALAEAREAGLAVDLGNAADLAYRERFDLTFTAGVLIHVPPEEIARAMAAVVAASRAYVLAVEYAADTEEPVLYRGHDSALWRRPFGKLYENMGLCLVKQGQLSKDAGFDNCDWWLFCK